VEYRDLNEDANERLENLLIVIIKKIDIYD
jgi:hypothetical protein